MRRIGRRYPCVELGDACPGVGRNPLFQESLLVWSTAMCVLCVPLSTAQDLTGRIAHLKNRAPGSPRYVGLHHGLLLLQIPLDLPRVHDANAHLCTCPACMCDDMYVPRHALSGMPTLCGAMHACLPPMSHAIHSTHAMH